MSLLLEVGHASINLELNSEQPNNSLPPCQPPVQRGCSSQDGFLPVLSAEFSGAPLEGGPVAMDQRVEDVLDDSWHFGNFWGLIEGKEKKHVVLLVAPDRLVLPLGDPGNGVYLMPFKTGPGALAKMASANEGDVRAWEDAFPAETWRSAILAARRL